MAADPHLHARLYGGRALEADFVPDPGFSGVWEGYRTRQEAREADRPHEEARQAEAAAFLARNERHAKRRRSAAVEAAIRREEAAELARSNAIAQAFAKAFARDHKR